MKIIKEEFKSIHELLRVVGERKNNSVMEGRKSSQEHNKSFTGTNNWEEAVSLFENGYSDVLEQIKTGLNKNTKASVSENRRRIQTGVIGYAPHVPNAILGLPNSMIRMESQPQKVKAVSIIYKNGANCGVRAEEFVKCGVSVLSVINTLERAGIRVTFKISFFEAKADNEYTIPTIELKNYREHLDILKLCFPIAHPSMFRRFGFKWLETTPEITCGSWAVGYGQSVQIPEQVRKTLDKNEFYIDQELIQKNNYDAEKIIAALNIK